MRLPPPVADWLILAAGESGHEGHSHTRPEELLAAALWPALALLAVLAVGMALLLGAHCLRRRALASERPCPGCGRYCDPEKDAACPACGRKLGPPAAGS